MEERSKAVLATRYFQDPKATRILREALKDKIDDVRLLAYSILDQKETEIRSAIMKTSEKLEHASILNCSFYLKRLAWLNWELVRLELVQGSTVKQFEQQAIEYADQVLKNSNDIDMQLLKGYILLRKNQLEHARSHFLKAVEAGLPKSAIEKKLIEISFLQFSFSEVIDTAIKLKNKNAFQDKQAVSIMYWSRSEMIHAMDLAIKAD